MSKNKAIFNVLMQKEIKEDILQSVRMAEREYGFISSRYSPSFLSLLVTYNPNINEVQCFSVNEYGSFENDDLVMEKSYGLMQKLNNSEKYWDNKLLSIIRAKDIHKIARNNSDSKLELENYGLKIYLDMLNKYFLES